MALHAERISLKNVFGVERFSFDPDGVSIIRGRNGSGKTSVIRAIHRLIEGGQHPDMLRKGTEDGSVLIEFTDGTEIEASLTERGTYYHLRGRDDVSARQLIAQVTDAVSVNPIEILRARSKDRGEILLEALPMTVERDEVKDALSPLLSSEHEFESLQSLPDLDGHALDVLGDTSSGMVGVLANERQGMYGARRDKQGTVKDLQDSIGDDAEDPDALRRQRQEINDDLDRKEQSKEKQIQEIDDWKSRKIREIREEAQAKKQECRDAYAPQLDALKEDRAKLEEKISQAERQQQTRETIQQRKEELEGLNDRYSALTDAIERLRSLKTSYRSDLPEDVSIEEGEIHDADGVPFEVWNEERKIRFATMIAEMRMGELQLIPVDGIEKLVGSQRKLFLDWAEQSPAQFILTEAVPDQDLTVEYLPETDEAAASDPRPGSTKSDDGSEGESASDLDGRDDIPF